MSRSYKKHPYSGEKQNKSNKIIANRKVRRNFEELNGKSNNYKKIYPSWDIRDFGNVAESFETFCNYLRNNSYLEKKYFKNMKPSLSFEEKAKIIYNAIFIRK